MADEPTLPPEEAPEPTDIFPAFEDTLEPTQDEKTWAALAHASILLALVSGGPLGPIAAFIIWLAKKEESAYIADQAMQSLVYQVAVSVLNWIMWLGIGVLSVVVIGICCIPLGILISLACLVYGVYGAYECSMGRDFRYFLIGDIVMRSA
jgi:uncharacterized Tic20 family protein